MERNQTTFSDRIERIEGSRRNPAHFGGRGGKMSESIVIHPDGFVQRITVPNRRLRFGFPLKGVIFACVVAVCVKAYLIWTIGDDMYGAAVAQLLNGNQFERAAGLVLAPDAVSMWLVDGYQQVYRFLVSVATALEQGTFPRLPADPGVA
jgi:hypothetical protein